MKILIVSDTHKKHDNLVRILEQEENIDLMVHLGDSEGYEDYIAELAGCPLEIVSGNNDFFTDLDREKVLEVGKYQVLITHGHYYYVAMGVEDLKKEALGRGMDIVMFGHTHRPLLDYSKGIVTLNPGSVSFPRQEGRRPSYALMELDQEGEAHFKIKYL
ncbi:metallophosphoesterase [Lachnospiraceae bacterium JLR.KK009]|jgi:putative phosphoesterase|nr:MJ0936 family phosphodiesterase [Lachnospiraceae bacterium A2]MCI8705679.1 metallophosphoesterase [Lachnospiraceae bacterium]MCI8882789.1 metallophosphoesterase [Lachnospiraceae bacterium]